MTESLEQLVTSRRIVVAVGAGGVGKTTTAAALGVAAAAHGRRVLCLTVDPARRLAQALGLERMSSEEQVIDPARFAATGLPLRGSLSAMMLDTKRTFDELVLKYSSTPERAKKLLGNKLYQYVSTSLAGTQEYMAMEKLVAVDREGRFDLIVLDTPPTTNALDFLDAPDRLVEALDSQTMRWFIQAFESTGKVSLNLLARSASVILRGLGRITGGGFLESMAEFITELNDLFGGFRQRAQEVEGVLRGPGVTFVLVTSPAPMSIQEVLFFNDRLEQAKLARRVRGEPLSLAAADGADGADRRGGADGGRGFGGRGRARAAPHERRACSPGARLWRRGSARGARRSPRALPHASRRGECSRGPRAGARRRRARLGGAGRRRARPHGRRDLNPTSGD